MSISNVRNRAGATFMRAVKRIDSLHKEIDRRAREGKCNEDTFKIKFASNGARIWSF